MRQSLDPPMMASADAMRINVDSDALFDA